MFSSPISKKSLIISIIISLIILTFYILSSIFNPQTKIVFCDVGQGDAAYIRIRNKIDVLIDTGPDKKILDCLGKHMPFYDRTIEYVILTHEQKDHTGGFEYIKDRYHVKSLTRENNVIPAQADVVPEWGNLTAPLSFLRRQAIARFHGNDRDYFTILWPTEEFYKRWCKNKKIENENTCALVLLYQEGNTSVLFTSDTSASILEKIISNQYFLNVETRRASSLLLKIPHHGSKYGINEKTLRQLNPKLSIISVGKNNMYGHPTKEVLNILNKYHYKYKRTDKEGDVVIKFKMQK